MTTIKDGHYNLLTINKSIWKPWTSSYSFRLVINAHTNDCFPQQNFLRDLLSKQKRKDQSELTEGKLQEYTDNLLSIFDANKDGKLQLNEMAKLVTHNLMDNQLITRI